MPSSDRVSVVSESMLVPTSASMGRRLRRSPCCRARSKLFISRCARRRFAPTPLPPRAVSRNWLARRSRDRRRFAVAFPPSWSTVASPIRVVSCVTPQAAVPNCVWSLHEVGSTGCVVVVGSGDELMLVEVEGSTVMVVVTTVVDVGSVDVDEVVVVVAGRDVVVVDGGRDVVVGVDGGDVVVVGGEVDVVVVEGADVVVRAGSDVVVVDGSDVVVVGGSEVVVVGGSVDVVVVDGTHAAPQQVRR